MTAPKKIKIATGKIRTIPNSTNLTAITLNGGKTNLAIERKWKHTAHAGD